MDSYADSPGHLKRTDTGGVGNLLVGFKSSTTYSVGAACEIPKHHAVEMSLLEADLDFGTHDSLNDRSIHLGDASLYIFRAGVMFSIDQERGLFDASRPRRGLWRVGPFLGVARATDVTVAEDGMSAVGIQEITGGSTLIYGLELRGDLRIGRSPWTVGGNFIFSGSSDPLLEISTDASSIYASGSVKYSPISLMMGAGYRF